MPKYYVEYSYEYSDEVDADNEEIAVGIVLETIEKEISTTAFSDLSIELLSEDEDKDEDE